MKNVNGMGYFPLSFISFLVYFDILTQTQYLSSDILYIAKEQKETDLETNR